MKLPIVWLNDYINKDFDIDELENSFTLSGTKVEEIIRPYEKIEKVYTGKIKKIKAHPDADKLVICHVDMGDLGDLQIVTAATNMKEEDIVPVAMHKARLFDGYQIKKGKLRGQVSEGMLCSLEELGLEEEDQSEGIFILEKDTPLGVDIKEVLELNKEVLDFEITSNRSDCLSVVGLTREVSAVYGLPYKKINLKYRGHDIDSNLKAEIDTPLCSRYMAREVTDIKVEESPLWLKRRLMESGIRPINTIVDLTNFVMLETGQPLHAFDRNDIKSDLIRVTESKEGDTFTTLDGVERKLHAGVVLINDDREKIALGGIMGGLDSEVKEGTNTIVIESASFLGTPTRENSNKLGIRTEASERFEKDISPELASMALDRICHLIEKMNLGKVSSYTVDEYPNPKENPEIEFSKNFINSFLGTDITKEKMIDILNSLEIDTVSTGEDTMKSISPYFRNDLFIKEDMAEEIARIYGYNNIESTLSNVTSHRSGRYKDQITRRRLLSLLISSGLSEAIMYSFIGEKDLDKILVEEDSKLRDAVKIKNPLGADFNIMRTTTLPQMMEALSLNYSRGNRDVKLFEIGKVYIKEGEVLPNEKNILTIGMQGKDLFYKLKGVVELIESTFKLKELKYRRSKNKFYHPGVSADMYIEEAFLGSFGKVHPDVIDNFKLSMDTYILEMDLDLLYKLSDLERSYKKIPKYPAVTRDIAVTLKDSILVQDIETIIKEEGGDILESYKIFDVYRGSQIDDDLKSVAYSLVYRDINKTLTDKEVNKVHDRIVKRLEEELGAKLR